MENRYDTIQNTYECRVRRTDRKTGKQYNTEYECRAKERERFACKQSIRYNTEYKCRAKGRDLFVCWIALWNGFSTVLSVTLQSFQSLRCRRAGGGQYRIRATEANTTRSMDRKTLDTIHNTEYECRAKERDLFVCWTALWNGFSTCFIRYAAVVSVVTL